LFATLKKLRRQFNMKHPRES